MFLQQLLSNSLPGPKHTVLYAVVLFFNKASISSQQMLSACSALPSFEKSTNTATKIITNILERLCSVSSLSNSEQQTSLQSCFNPKTIAKLQDLLANSIFNKQLIHLAFLLSTKTKDKSEFDCFGQGQ